MGTIILVRADDAAMMPLVRGTIARPERRALRRNYVAGVLFAVIATVAVAMVILLWPGGPGKPKRQLEQIKVERLSKVGEIVQHHDLVGVEAFHVACGATLHSELCIQTLMPQYAAHSANAQGLTGILIASAAHEGVAATLAAVLGNRGVNRLGFSGERVCHSTLASSIEQLETALAALNSGPNFDEDIQTRLRAATEFHTTCIDALVATKALEAHTADAKQHTEKLLRNAMASVSALSQFGPNLRSWELRPPNLGITNLRMFLAPGDALPLWMSSNQDDDPPVDVLVAKDGSGKFKSIQAAIDVRMDAIGSANSAKRYYVIGIKAGVYNEQVIVPKRATNFMFLGAGAGVTVITGNKSVATTPGMTTFFSPTLIVEGAGFIGKGFTARNTAAGGDQQAVAMRVSADMAAFYQCAFQGGQDTLHTHTFRQHYRDCTIAGTADRFILGNAALATFQSCSMAAKNLS